MNPLREKRNQSRHHCEGPITLLHTQRHSGQIDADLINCSQRGVSFFSSRPLVPGTTIIIRISMETYPRMSPDADCQVRTMGFATIKWCQQGIRHGRPIHEMGAVYMMPY